jgi:hypothetical protein
MSTIEAHNNWFDSLIVKNQVNPLQQEPVKQKQENKISLINPDQFTEIGNYKTAQGCFGAHLIIDLHTDPREVISDARKAFENGSKSGFSGLVEFQNKVEKMSISDLRFTQKILLDLMSEPSNTDGDVLFALLKSVNKKLDSALKDPEIPGYLKLDRSHIVGAD